MSIISELKRVFGKQHAYDQLKDAGWDLKYVSYNDYDTRRMVWTKDIEQDYEIHVTISRRFDAIFHGDYTIEVGKKYYKSCKNPYRTKQLYASDISADDILLIRKAVDEYKAELYSGKHADCANLPVD